MTLEDLLKSLALNHEQSILDFGFGTGECLKSLKSYGCQSLSGFDVIQLDHLELDFADISIAPDSISWLQNQPEKFDVILAKESLYYIEKSSQSLLWKSLFNSLKPSGRLIVLTFNGALSTSNIILSKDLDIKLAFCENSLSNLAFNSGFVDIEVKELDISYRNTLAKIGFTPIIFAGKVLNKFRYTIERGLDPQNPKILSKTIYFSARKPPHKSQLALNSDKHK